MEERREALKERGWRGSSKPAQRSASAIVDQGSISPGVGEAPVRAAVVGACSSTGAEERGVKEEEAISFKQWHSTNPISDESTKFRSGIAG